MRLIIGGAYQGKKDFALTLTHLRERDIVDGAVCGEKELYQARIVDHLHLYLKRFPEQGKDPDAFARRVKEKNPEAVLIINELGCGIVPMDREDRAWRERCGRCAAALAALSPQVYRVICGLGVCLKSEEA